MDASALPSACFAEDVTSLRSAEEALSQLPLRGYLTWRESAARYYLSYNSSAFRKPQHVPIQRTPDGSYVCLESSDSSAFASLNELVATRPYVDHVRSDEDRSRVEAAGTEGKEIADAASGVQRRKAPRTKASVPQHVSPPPAAQSDAAAGASGDTAQYRIRPVASPVALQRLFATIAVVCAGVMCVSVYTHVRSGDSLHMHATAVSEAVRERIEPASAACARDMVRLHSESRVPLDASACSACVSVWRHEVTGAQAEAQASFDAHYETLLAPFIRSHLVCVLFGVCMAVAMQWINTGARNLDFRARDYATDEDALAALGGKMEPPCTRMQFTWALTFMLVLGTIGVSAGSLGEVLWSYGRAPYYVEYAARPFSVAHRIPDKNGSLPAPPDSVIWTAPTTPWQAGLYGDAWHTVPATEECIQAVQPFVEDLVEHPALVRANARFLLPQLIVNYMDTARGASRDSWSVRDPWRSISWLAGWWDGGSIILPSQASVARATVMLAGALLATLLLHMVLSDLVLGWLQHACSRTRRDGRRAATSASHVKRD